jgi:NDP-hexose-3-ketoreductase
MGVSAQPVKVGVWGLGRHARRRILPAIARCPSTLLTGVTTRDQNVSRDEAARYECQSWPTPTAMLNDCDLDAVYVSTPTGLHAPHGMMVLRAGKHLWCEKPLCATLPEAQQLSRTARNNDLALCEGLMYLYHPHFSAVRRIVSDPAFGHVLSIRSQFGLPPLEQPGFRLDPVLGGGALLDLAPYPLSAVLELVDQPLDVIASNIEGQNGCDVDISGFALLSTADQTTRAYLEWGYERAYRNHLSVWGEHGSLLTDFIFSKADEYRPSVYLRDKRGGVEVIRIDPADSFHSMFVAFTEVVLDGTIRERHREAIETRAGYLDRLGA